MLMIYVLGYMGLILSSYFLWQWLLLALLVRSIS